MARKVFDAVALRSAAPTVKHHRYVQCFVCDTRTRTTVKVAGIPYQVCSVVCERDYWRRVSVAARKTNGVAPPDFKIIDPKPCYVCKRVTALVIGMYRVNLCSVECETVYWRRRGPGHT